MALLAVCQTTPGTDPAVNLQTVRDLATAATGRGATLVAFPEYSSFFEPQLGADSVAAGEMLDGVFASTVGEIARGLGIHIVAGMLETADAGRVSNTLIAVSPAGAIVATYRKLHLYDAFGHRESDRVRPGEVGAPETFEWEGLTVGLQTCYDIRFPEVSRRLVDAGAEVLVVPAEWVRGPLKEQHWRTLLTARALENTVYVAAADHAPPVGVGNSMVVDPMGVELVTIGEETGFALTEVSAQRVSSVREINPSLALRRFGTHPL